jgi:DNA (cytosine-5)-methyltransferase 1
MRGEPQCRFDQLFAADIFSGSGAVTAALKKVGFRMIFAIDSDPLACRTYPVVIANGE